MLGFDAAAAAIGIWHICEVEGMVGRAEYHEDGIEVGPSAWPVYTTHRYNERPSTPCKRGTILNTYLWYNTEVRFFSAAPFSAIWLYDSETKLVRESHSRRVLKPILL